MTDIVCLGEGMLELSRCDEDWQMGFGGDTLNTAIHLARSGHAVSYMTALGADPFSEDLKRRWAANGIDCGLVVTHPVRTPGLYAITIDEVGERSFTYWRDSSAARALFDIEGVGAALEQAHRAALFCFSLISLAILPFDGRQKVIALASRVRENGGKVAFDGNYRPRLWESVEAAQYWRDAAASEADIGLPTFEDELALSGLETPADASAYWLARGCNEVVVKAGSDGCLLPSMSFCPVPKQLRPVDTSGAGDAFNGGYLAARLRGASVLEAAQAGHALAGWTVMRRGAIPERDEAAPY